MVNRVISAFNRNLIIVSNNGYITDVVFDNSKRYDYLVQNTITDSNSGLLQKTIRQIKYHESKKLKIFDVPLKLNGTDFQISVWRELQNIKYGHKLTYLDVAKKIGRPNSYRAVANAIGANPIAIIIPCHRVIKSNGEIGGYSSGAKTKIVLKEIEK